MARMFVLLNYNNLVGTEWGTLKPMEKIMILWIQVSITYHNAWLEACL